MSTRIVCVIPARMGSSRFPGKPLAPILGMPMVEHIYRRCRMSPAVAEVHVATCDQAIHQAVSAFGGSAIMTADTHERASDRVAEAATHLSADIVLMVQGDEPMVVPDMLDQAVAPMLRNPSIPCVNLRARITDVNEVLDRNTIKVVADRAGDALYMSRSAIPERRQVDPAATAYYKQVCIIPFRRDALATFARLAPTPLEQAESIDMLRFLEHGMRVRLVDTQHSTHAVDTPADLAYVEGRLREDPLTRQYLAAPKARA